MYRRHAWYHVCVQRHGLVYAHVTTAMQEALEDRGRNLDLRKL